LAGLAGHRDRNILPSTTFRSNMAKKVRSSSTRDDHLDEWSRIGVSKENSRSWKKLGVDVFLLDHLAHNHPSFFPLRGVSGIQRLRKLRRLGYRPEHLQGLLDGDDLTGSKVLEYVLKRLNSKNPITFKKLSSWLDGEPDEREKFYIESNYSPEGM
jgi:hypothetical protein